MKEKNGKCKLVCEGIASIINSLSWIFFEKLKLRELIWRKIGQEFLNIIKSIEKLWI